MSLYNELDVGKDADKPTIKKAFRKKAQELHPDKEGGDAEKFAMVKLACDVLMDDERRKQYDETGTTDKARQPKDAAREKLAMVFDAIISMEGFNGDIIREAQARFSQAKVEFKVFKEKLKKELKRLKKLSGRVKAKKTNLYQQIIDNKIDGINRGIAKAEQDLIVLDEIFLLLEDYEDDVPEPEFPEITITRPSGFFSFTGA